MSSALFFKILRSSRYQPAITDAATLIVGDTDDVKMKVYQEYIYKKKDIQRKFLPISAAVVLQTKLPLRELVFQDYSPDYSLFLFIYCQLVKVE